MSQPDRRRGRGSALVPSPVKAAALELGLPVTDRVADVVDHGVPLGVVVAYGRLIKADVLAPCRWSTSTSPSCPGGGGRRRSSGPSSPATTAPASTSWRSRRRSTPAGSTPGPRWRSVPTTRSRTCGPAWSPRAAASWWPALRDGLGDARPQVGEPTYADKLGPEERHLDWRRPRSTCTAACGWATPGRRTPAAAQGVAHPRAAAAARVRWCRPVTGPSSWSRCSPRARARMAGHDWARRRPLDARRRAGLVTDSARRLALDALDRIERDGAYANLLLPELLEPEPPRGARPSLRHRARLRHHPDAAGLRLPRRPLRHPRPRPAGAQRAAPRRLPAARARPATPRRGRRDGRGRPQAGARPGERGAAPGGRARPSTGPTTPPASATRTGSSTAWSRTSARPTALGALEVMNTPPPVTERADGYVQDLASQWVADAGRGRAGRAGRRPLRRARRQGHRAGRHRRRRRGRRHPQGPRRAHPGQRRRPCRCWPPTRRARRSRRGRSTGC